ncbi:type IV pilus assembly protein PilV [Variovorax boronicumulans]|jgi:type IV pilus assembly protein PilV|uniref:type IV pilus modification protein PilV n=1 Tax=Variovorax boronicumulans TaxID=436515 RepID=UPI002783B373|nr:type IV pilus modification protein PilV [Variovorax boronicumulans]MDQ0081487.1 type IV pilus assembly protein PilV [Variovorax boronicumulans]
MQTARPMCAAVAGFSLLEVLVSIIVLTVGLLGASGMLLSAMRTTSESGNFSSAINLARELSEKARANKAISIKTTATDNAYLVDWKSGDAVPGTSTAGTTCISSDCTTAQLASWDVNNWVKRVDAALPGSRVKVCFDSDPWDASTSAYKWTCDPAGRNLVVKLSWTPRQTNSALSDENAATRPPRVVVQLVPGQSYAAYTPVGF